MRIELASLPEFGVSVNWAMCRNPMCTNFGIPFEGKIPHGRKSRSDQRYTVSLVIGSRGHPVAVIHCKGCGQTSRLASNAAIRPIARYFLSLSLPFADCPNTDCQNHGVNLYEHWPPTGKGRSPYRAMGDHTARCKACDGNARSGGRASSISLGTPRRAVDSPETRNRWRALLDALPAAHSIAEITGMLGVSYATYHRDLARLGARLNDYHAFQNARLLHPDTPNRDRPISLYTGDMTLPARFSAKRNGAKSLSVIVTVASAGGANFVLAAHPCFLPAVLCPDAATLAADGRRPPLESEWDALQHPFGDGSERTLDKREDAVPADPTPDGFFVRTPYAALAHFLVVQKMLSRFRVIHNTINAADGRFTAALVAYRDRILAGRPDAEIPAAPSAGPPRTAEVVLFSFAPPGGRLKTRPVGRPSAAPEISPDDAWRAAEERFAEQPVPAHLEKDGLSWDHPRVRAAQFRRAFKGAYSKSGGWAWLHHPPDMPGYRDPRTLWLTRTRHKTFERHGRPLLDGASLQPLHAVFNAIRSQVRAASRPFARSGRAAHASSRVAAVLNEFAIYLLLRNYGLIKRPRLPGATIPAEAMGLADEETPDPAEIAGRFRLGIEHARQISRWCRG